LATRHQDRNLLKRRSDCAYDLFEGLVRARIDAAERLTAVGRERPKLIEALSLAVRKCTRQQRPDKARCRLQDIKAYPLRELTQPAKEFIEEGIVHQ
jgi:hypothetical protein